MRAHPEFASSHCRTNSFVHRTASILAANCVNRSVASQGTWSRYSPLVDPNLAGEPEVRFEEMRNAFARTDPGWFHDERFGSVYSPWLFGQANDDSVRHGFKQGGPKKQVEFRIYPVSKGRSVLQTSRGQQKCASVSDFSRSRCSLQKLQGKIATRNEL